MQQLTVGQEYDVEAELVFNKKYKSYQYKPYVVISKRPSTREEQEKFLHALLTNSQANALISAYPNIVNEIIEGTDNVDLQNVKGIGYATYERIKDMVLSNYVISDILSLLQPLGVSYKMIQKLLSGEPNPSLLKAQLLDNPYIMTRIRGLGFKCVITINMNRLIQNAVRNDKDIKVALSEQVDDIHKYLLAYDALLQDSFNANLLPVYDAGYISLEKQFLTIGINGLVEGAEYLGYSISPDDKEYCNFVNELLSVIYQKNKAARTSDVMFNTEYVPAENLGVKNSKWDKEDGYFSPRECYNSYFYLVDDVDTTPIDKFILHGKTMTGNLDGGAALHLNLDEHLSKEQYKHLMKVAIKTGCSYWTVNVPNTICNDCGHISKHHLDHCEKCGSKNIDYATRVIGYLKRVSNFSEARQKEAKKRYYAKA